MGVALFYISDQLRLQLVLHFGHHQFRLITSLTRTQWTWSYFSSLNAFSIVFKLVSNFCDTPKYTYNKYCEHYKNAYIKPNVAISLKENNTNMSSSGSDRKWIALNKLQVGWINQITSQVNWLLSDCIFLCTRKKIIINLIKVPLSFFQYK